MYFLKEFIKEKETTTTGQDIVSQECCRACFLFHSKYDSDPSSDPDPDSDSDSSSLILNSDS